MFTAIPTGIVSADSSKTRASLSVYVTPQITDATPVSSSPLANWPKIAAGLTFGVYFVAPPPNNPSAVATLDPNPVYAANRFDQALWQAIFSSGQPVTPWAPQSRNMTKSGLLSYRAEDVSSAVKATYAAAAQSKAHPVITNGSDAISQQVRDIANAVPYAASVGAQVQQNVGGLGTNGKPAASLSSAALTQVKSTYGSQPNFPKNGEWIRAAAFHNVGNYRKLAPTSPSPVTAPDFHEILGHLSDHPVLLRRLGLVIDLVVDLPAGLSGGTSLYVAPMTPIDSVQVTHPWTLGMIHLFGASKPPTFRPYYGDVDPYTGEDHSPSSVPAVSPAPVAFLGTNGQVRTDQTGAAYIDDLDIDHAVTRLSDASSKVADDLAASPAVTMTLPGLRTTGLALHQVDREGKLGARFQDTSSWNPNGTSFLAENLVRGYRVDVRSTGAAAWSSLCLRRTSIQFAGGFPTIVVPAPDEGIVRAAPATTASDDSIYNVNESLFHWDGWSLVAARPGLAVGPGVSGNGTPTDGPVAPISDGSSVGMPFTTTVTAQPGSLPRLRFGASYQFRVRAVDLCGNDMAVSGAPGTTDYVSPATPFTRYEPVSPPALQLRRPLTEGENVERMVIRSDPYASPPVYADAWAANNGGGMNPYASTCERHVAPPKTSVHLAEYHGAIDAAVAAAPPGQARANAAWTIVGKEDGSFYDRMVTDTTTRQYRTYAQPGRTIVTPPSAAPLVANALALGQPAFTGNQDIAPRGTVLQSGQYVAFDADSIMLPYLPDPNASGIALQGLASTPTLRSYSARANNASGGAWPELSTFRLVLNESRGALTSSGLGAQSSGGAAPATISLPPATVLTLAYGSTLADPTVHAFGPKTASDPNFVNAQQGALPALTPTRTLTLVHAVQRPLAPTLRGGDVVVVPRNEGDTVQPLTINVGFDGPSTGRVDLVASWVEYVDVPSAANPTLDPSTNPVSHTGAIASLSPNAGDGPWQQSVRQMFGDTKRRDVTYSAVATTRFREYFPASVTSNAANITAAITAPAPLVCPSSARPPTPRVLYAIPAFTFHNTASGSTSTRTRSGGTIRVYCDRGWFASGADERLAVLLSTVAKSQTPNLVSVWGNDPSWGRGTLGALDASHLNPANYVSVVNGVPLAEGVGTVNVATYRPTFNADRGLWYFDIGLSPDQAYFPFLRLALARFQPESIGNLNLSRVVTTEFVQLTADRTASVAAQGNGNYAVTLSGVTATNLPTALTPVNAAQWSSGHTVTAEIQQATTASPDPLDWTTITAPVMLTPSQLNGYSVTYQGNVALPAGLPAGSSHRVLFREYEVYAADNQDSVRAGIGIVELGVGNTSYRTRAVYTDAVTISG
jgi:hypothetical protein